MPFCSIGAAPWSSIRRGSSGSLECSNDSAAHTIDRRSSNWRERSPPRKSIPDAIESDRDCDLSAANHEETKLLVCKLAGIDDELAAAIEQSYGDLTTYRTYPEVVDVITTASPRHRDRHRE